MAHFFSLDDPFKSDRYSQTEGVTRWRMGWSTWTSPNFAFFRVRIEGFPSAITCVFFTFHWPILRTRPPADRTRRPLQRDRSRSVVVASERIGRHHCYRV